MAMSCAVARPIGIRAHAGRRGGRVVCSGPRRTVARSAIQVGDSVPEVTLYEGTVQFQRAAEVSTGEAFKGKALVDGKVVASADLRCAEKDLTA